MNDTHIAFAVFVAGHSGHAMTTATALDPVFEYLQEMRIKQPTVIDM